MKITKHMTIIIDDVIYSKLPKGRTVNIYNQKGTEVDCLNYGYNLKDEELLDFDKMEEICTQHYKEREDV